MTAAALEPRLAGLAACTVLAYAVQTTTGFGSQVIALSLGALLFPLEEVMPVVVALNLGVCAAGVLRDRGRVDLGLLVGRVLPWMFAGAAAGLAIAVSMTGRLPRWPFGAIVLASAARELARLRSGREGDPPSPIAGRALLLAGGVAHGLYASGGPLVVASLTRSGLDPARLRATLLALWLVLNSLVLGTLIARGAWTEAATTRALALLPTVPLGVFLGEAARSRADDRTLRVAIQCLLVVAGLALLS